MSVDNLYTAAIKKALELQGQFYPTNNRLGVRFKSEQDLNSFWAWFHEVERTEIAKGWYSKPLCSVEISFNA
jgi:hypothetical protein